MFNLDEKVLKCSLTLAILFFALSHPYLYRVCHNTFSTTVSFLDLNGCPTELGVFIMAIVFAVVVYNGHQYFSIDLKKNKNKNRNNSNALLGKCRTYCEQVSQEMEQEKAMMNNIANTNNNVAVQMAPVPSVLNNQALNNQAMNNQALNNQAINNQAMNNQAIANNIQMNQNRMNNALMNNQMQNNNNVQMANNNLAVNNVAVNQPVMNNLQMDTGSTDMGLLNAQTCSDSPQCSGNSSMFSNGMDMNQNNSFVDNNSYHDDMYATF